MSSAKLLLSGSLVAGGLILGAFTLHGTFDPQRPQTAGRHESPAKAVNAFQTRPATAESVAQDAAPKAVKAGARPDAAHPADAKAAARAAARRRLAQKKRAEKERAERAAKEKLVKAKQQPQQASFKWPWNW